MDKKWYGLSLGRGRPIILWKTCLNHENLAPFGKNAFLSNVGFMHFPKIYPTLTRCKSLNFCHMKEIFIFLETSKSPLTNAFGLISKLFLMLLVCPFEKSVFLLTLKMTCNVFGHIFKMVNPMTMGSMAFER